MAREIEDISSDPDRIYETKTLKNMIDCALNETLSKREEYFLTLRFGLNDTGENSYSFISQKLGISIYNVKRIIDSALEKLKESKYADSLKEYY